MQLTHSQLTQVAALHSEYLSVVNQITEIGKLIHSLLNDDCTVDFSFNIHNETIHEENKLKAGGISEYLFGGLLTGMIAPNNNMHGIDARQLQLKPCQHSIIFKMTETRAVRMLNILLEERNEYKERVHLQIEDILRPTINLHITNPIHDLHN